MFLVLIILVLKFIREAIRTIDRYRVLTETLALAITKISLLST